MPWSSLNKVLLEELLSPPFLQLPSFTSHYQKWIKSKSNEFQIHHWNTQFMPHSFMKTPVLSQYVFLLPIIMSFLSYSCKVGDKIEWRLILWETHVHSLSPSAVEISHWNSTFHKHAWYFTNWILYDIILNEKKIFRYNCFHYEKG